MATQNAVNLTEPGIVVYDGIDQFLPVTFTAGTGISIDDSDPTDIVISSAADEFVWIRSSGAIIRDNTGYCVGTVGSPPVFFGLNSSAVARPIGFTFAVQGVFGASNWLVQCLVGQRFYLNGLSGTRVLSTDVTDGAEFVCVSNASAGTEVFAVRSVVGNLIINP